jgi:hypothetical protein
VGGRVVINSFSSHHRADGYIICVCRPSFVFWGPVSYMREWTVLRQAEQIASGRTWTPFSFPPSCRDFYTHTGAMQIPPLLLLWGGLDCDHKSLPLIVVCSFFDSRLLGRVVLLSLLLVVRMLFLLLPRTMDTFDDSIFSRPSNNKTLES